MQRLIPTEEQEEDIERIISEPTQAALVASGMGVGKANPVSEPVLTPKGFVPMGSLRVGDRVVGLDGTPTEVLGVYPQGEQEIVEFTLSDGTTVRSTWDHLWTVREQGKPNEWKTLTTRQMVERGLEQSGGSRYFLPLVEPVQFDDQAVDLPLDGYTLGVLLGDGSLSHMPSLNTDIEIAESLVWPEGVSLSGERGRSEADYNGQWNIRGIIPTLELLGLRGRSEDKFIPYGYLVAPVEVRQAVLAGLLDTDGTPAGVSIEYGTVSENLADDVRFLVQSLGGTVSTTEKTPTYTYRGERREGQKFYRQIIRVPENPFRLTRKRDGLKISTKYPIKRAIRSARVVGREQAQCINVAAQDSLYVMKDFVVTHNTLIACEVVTRLEAEVTLIICPKGVRVNFERTLTRQGHEQPQYRIDGTKKGKAAWADLLASKPGVYLIGREYFRMKDWQKVKPDVVIFDEAHSIQNRKSLGFRQAKGLKAKRLKIAMSGTPSGNRFDGLWAVTFWLWPTLMDRSYWRWAAEWARTEFDYKAGREKIVGERDEGAFVSTLPCYIRRMANLDVEVISETRLVELTPMQRKMYDQMEDDMIMWLEENPSVAQVPIVQRIRLRQITLGVPTMVDGEITFAENCKSSKIDALKEIIADYPDEPMLILTDSKHFAHAVAHQLGDKAATWTGAETHRRREILKEQFLDGEVKYLVATIPAVAEGIDGFQEVCNHMVWLSRSENRILNEQALARLHRTGQTEHVYSFDIQGVDTYDSGIFERLELQASEMSRTLTIKEVL